MLRNIAPTGLSVEEAVEINLIPKNYSISQIPQKEAVRIILSHLETSLLAKIWCVKMKKNAHKPNDPNRQIKKRKHI